MDGPAADLGHEDNDLIIIDEPEVSQAAADDTLAQAEGTVSKRTADEDLAGPRKRQRGA